MGPNLGRGVFRVYGFWGLVMLVRIWGLGVQGLRLRAQGFGDHTWFRVGFKDFRANSLGFRGPHQGGRAYRV